MTVAQQHQDLHATESPEGDGQPPGASMRCRPATSIAAVSAFGTGAFFPFLCLLLARQVTVPWWRDRSPPQP